MGNNHDRSQLELPCCEQYSRPSLVRFGDKDMMRDSQEARREAHILDTAGSIPAPASNDSISAPVQPVRVGFATLGDK